MGTATVKTAAEFETSMSQVQATMGITKDSMSKVDGQSVNTMDTLKKLAKKMGSETAFSASQCAEALNYLALAGYDTQEMCDTLPTVLDLAAAGNIDLASASDMVTDAMSALGMKTSDASKMVNQMANIEEKVRGDDFSNRIVDDIYEDNLLDETLVKMADMWGELLVENKGA